MKPRPDNLPPSAAPQSECSAADSGRQPRCRTSRLRWGGVVVGLVLPTIVTAAYFLPAGRQVGVLLRVIYGLGKLVQFSFPLVWVFLVLRSRESAHGAPVCGRPDDLQGAGGKIAAENSLPAPHPGVRGASGAWALGQAVAFGAAVTAAMLLGYHFWLRFTPMMQAAAEVVRARMGYYGIDTLPRFACLGLFYCVAHSGLEEYYWRWFVFGQLRGLMRLWPAIIVASLGFMAHHVLVLGVYFRDCWWAAAWFSLAVAVGGAYWAWLYDRSRSLLGPWLSHAIVDAGIFLIGYLLVFHSAG